MSRHLQRDLDALHHDILSMSAVVESMIDCAAMGLLERRRDLCLSVIAGDVEVDRREVSIEEECLKILALHQPVAIDLRRIATVLKVNNDLERIADLAVNISERSLSLYAFPQFSLPSRLKQMVTMATQMVRGALDSFVQLDTDASKRILAMDDTIDELNVEVIDGLQVVMQQEPTLVVPALHCFSASRHIERIGDHATNIAEDVIYLVDGDIVRHQHLDPEAT
jgi:phosphate transport system protein